jgi:hypothetical protein
LRYLGITEGEVRVSDAPSRKIPISQSPGAGP